MDAFARGHHAREIYPLSYQMHSPSGSLNSPGSVLYLTSEGSSFSYRVRAWVTQTRLSTAVAGVAGTGGFSGDGGPGTLAKLRGPTGLTVDASGAVFIADAGNKRIRLLSAAGTPPSLSHSPSPSASSTSYCWSSLYRALTSIDLVGTLVGSARFPGVAFVAASERDCRQECCDAPACDAYSFFVAGALTSGAGSACYLYVHVTAQVPNSGFSSGMLVPPAPNDVVDGASTGTIVAAVACSLFAAIAISVSALFSRTPPHTDLFLRPRQSGKRRRRHRQWQLDCCQQQ